MLLKTIAVSSYKLQVLSCHKLVLNYKKITVNFISYKKKTQNHQKCKRKHFVCTTFQFNAIPKMSLNLIQQQQKGRQNRTSIK